MPLQSLCVLNSCQDAIRCYKRAVTQADKEGIALSKLARLHEQRGELHEAAHYYERHLKMADEEHVCDML